MTHGDVLSTEQLRSLIERLQESRDVAKALLQPQTGGINEIQVGDNAIGRLTRMDAIQVQAMTDMNRSQLSVRLQQIEGALVAFDAGRYGYCNRCKEPVDIERLMALPSAPLCLACQEAIEGS